MQGLIFHFSLIILVLAFIFFDLKQGLIWVGFLYLGAILAYIHVSWPRIKKWFNDQHFWLKDKEKVQIFYKARRLEDPKNPPKGSKRIWHIPRPGGRPPEGVDEKALDLIQNHDYTLREAFEEIILPDFPERMRNKKNKRDRIWNNFRRRMKRKLK